MMDTVIARVLKTDNQGRATVIAVDDKAYIAAWTVNGDISSEREACAKVAEDYAGQLEENGQRATTFESLAHLDGMINGANMVASLIRGRGER